MYKQLLKVHDRRLRGHPQRISDFLGHFLIYLPTHIRFYPIGMIVLAEQYLIFINLPTYLPKNWISFLDAPYLVSQIADTYNVVSAGKKFGFSNYHNIIFFLIIQVRENPGNRPSLNKCALSTDPVIRMRISEDSSSWSFRTYLWPCRLWFVPWSFSKSNTRILSLP